MAFRFTEAKRDGAVFTVNITQNGRREVIVQAAEAETVLKDVDVTFYPVFPSVSEEDSAPSRKWPVEPSVPDTRLGGEGDNLTCDVTKGGVILRGCVCAACAPHWCMRARLKGAV